MLKQPGTITKFNMRKDVLFEDENSDNENDPPAFGPSSAQSISQLLF